MKYESIKRIHKYSTTSTNDDAFTEAERGLVTIVTADRQTAARGRFGRAYSADEGGAYLSVCAEAEADYRRNLLLTPLAAVCVCRAIGEDTGISPRIKWCNDVLFDGKKVCGILCEMREKNGVPFVTVGVGVNIHNPLPENLPNAVGLGTAARKILSVSDLRDGIAEKIIAMLSADDGERKAMMREYKSHCINIGRRVTATVNGKKTEGTAVDITDLGALVLQADDGSRKEIFSGEATLKP